jgi:hypothetical protein
LSPNHADRYIFAISAEQMPSQALYKFITACKTWAMKTRDVSYQVKSDPRADTKITKITQI